MYRHTSHAYNSFPILQSVPNFVSVYSKKPITKTTPLNKPFQNVHETVLLKGAADTLAAAILFTCDSSVAPPSLVGGADGVAVEDAVVAAIDGVDVGDDSVASDGELVGTSAVGWQSPSTSPKAKAEHT
jgi:hypothetical protein